mmetsp:Transcript_8742/g.15830  ORF Transcript_8742/g.15830 Transcript_8742/m.15830 type:complete len:274 (+) Transcript_8742:58-879(+)|eukprot:CAMPEP_0201668734 /NCGR_PEP_ID=MMETSP0494-20130426/20807_1 /ASSEMBLY_ACC=CAM_ASM_000839 /TAXON_ID=420259 /ORGANISM="Thalassiosira gravida, Strain GMp14c1" /LENGTH=273 /DNA_ID=CAMNT_0048149251 /DNA_START=20 /DNA_END=841 /DNA_ORIENTATION=+
MAAILRSSFIVTLATTFLHPSSFFTLALVPPAQLPPKIYTSASSIPDPPPPTDPFIPSIFDDALLSVFRWTLQQQSGVALPNISGFDGMVAELHELHRRSRGTDELERVSLQTMTALAGPIPIVYKTFFARWEATPAVLAWFAKYLLPFLVGEMTLTSTSSSHDDASISNNNSNGSGAVGGGLLVERCRVLEGSKCMGVCAKMCKVPTERFFAERWGVPLSMEPNFETGACQLRFGVVPLDVEDDPTIPPGCLGRCPGAAVAALQGDGPVEMC